MTIIIPFFNTPRELAVLLVQLQPQLHPNDDIYIIDNSKERSGFTVANIYGSTRCYIFVEVGDYTFDQSVEFGKQSVKENKQESYLVLRSNSIISQTLIANFKRKVREGEKEPIPNMIMAPYPKFPANFQWYYPNFDSEWVVLSYKKSQYTP